MSEVNIVKPKTEYQLNMRVLQVVPPHKSTDGMRKRMKTMNVDSCAFSVRKSLSTSVLTGTSTVSLFLSSVVFQCFNTQIYTLRWSFFIDKFPCMQSGLVACHGCSQSLKGTSEDLKQHFTESFCSPSNRQYHMMPSHKHSGQSPVLTAQTKILPTLQQWQIFPTWFISWQHRRDHWNKITVRSFYYLRTLISSRTCMTFFFCNTQKEMFWRMFTPNRSIVWGWYIS